MQVKHILSFFILICLAIGPGAHAQKGFSIEGGLIFDRPNGGSHNKPYAGMNAGFGYVANFGYDFFDKGGLEIGVMHTSHAYELAVINGAVMEDNADKIAIFVKARGIPFRRGKFELVAEFGAGLYDIAGKKLLQDNEVDEDFSGIGLITNLSFRYYISGGLTASFYMGANFVDYNRYELPAGNRASYSGKMPGGDSINWGITIFHRIGIPQL